MESSGGGGGGGGRGSRMSDSSWRSDRCGDQCARGKASDSSNVTIRATAKTTMHAERYWKKRRKATGLGMPAFSRNDDVAACETMLTSTELPTSFGSVLVPKRTPISSRRGTAMK